MGPERLSGRNPFERSTNRLWACRSTWLSYGPFIVT